MSETLTERLLHLMSDGNWHSAEELVDKISHRFSATMHSLKQRGYQFDKRHLEKNQYEYRLIQ